MQKELCEDDKVTYNLHIIKRGALIVHVSW